MTIITRRRVLAGLIAAPAVVKFGSIMPVKPLPAPGTFEVAPGVYVSEMTIYRRGIYSQNYTYEFPEVVALGSRLHDKYVEEAYEEARKFFAAAGDEPSGFYYDTSGFVDYTVSSSTLVEEFA